VTEISFPPPRDLTAGQLAARKQHLLGEIAREQEGRRLRVPPRPALVIALAVLALAIAAVAIGSHSLFAVSNHCTRVHAGPSVRRVLDGHIFIKAGLPFNAQKPHSFRRLAFRQGIGIYTARTIKGNHLCYYVGSRYRGKLLLNGFGCTPAVGELALPGRFWAASGRKAQRDEHAWLRNHPFPSPARPVLVMSGGGGEGEYTYLQPVGLAANGVRSIQMLPLLDCHPALTVPVIDNVFIDANAPHVAESFMVARNASGKVIWHSAPLDPPGAFVRTPLDRKVPRDCGFH